MLVFPAQQTSGHRAAKVAFGLKPALPCGNHQGPYVPERRHSHCNTIRRCAASVMGLKLSRKNQRVPFANFLRRSRILASDSAVPSWNDPNHLSHGSSNEP